MKYQKASIFIIAIFAMVFGCWLFIMSFTYISSSLISIHDKTLYLTSKRELYVGVIFGAICFIAGFSSILSGVLLLLKKICWSLYIAIIPVLILTVSTIVLLSIIPIGQNDALWVIGGYIIVPIFILIAIGIIKIKKFIAV
jgi:hypothetical protein